MHSETVKFIHVFDKKAQFFTNTLLTATTNDTESQCLIQCAIPSVLPESII